MDMVMVGEQKDYVDLRGEEEGEGREVEGEESQEREEKRAKREEVPGPPGLTARPVHGEHTQPLSLNDLLTHMQAGFTRMSKETQENKYDLTQELNKVKQEQLATKEMAAKTLTNTDALKDQMAKLEARTANLKTDRPPNRPQTQARHKAPTVGLISWGGQMAMKQ